MAKDAKLDDHKTKDSSHSQSVMGSQSHFVKSSSFASECHQIASTITSFSRATFIAPPPLTQVSCTVNETQRSDTPLPHTQALPLTHNVNGNENRNLNCDQTPKSTPALRQRQTPSPLSLAPILYRSYDLQQLRRAEFSFCRWARAQ